MTGYDLQSVKYNVHVNVGLSQMFSKKYSEINAKNLQYNINVILTGTNRAYILKNIWDRLKI